MLVSDLILDFCYSSLSLETGGFELTSTITFALQANRLTKCNRGYAFRRKFDRGYAFRRESGLVANFKIHIIIYRV